MYIRTCVSIYTVCVCEHAHTCVYVCMCVFMCACICVCMYMCVCMYIVDLSIWACVLCNAFMWGTTDQLLIYVGS